MKMPPRTRRPSQMIARRRLRGLDCIMSEKRALLLGGELIEEIAQDLVAHYAGIREGLAFGMENGGGCLVHVVEVTESHIFLNGSIDRAGFNDGADLDHFR